MRDATQILGFLTPTGETRRITGASRGELDEWVDAYRARAEFLGFPNRRDANNVYATEVLEELGTTVEMYVNEDRWVGTCPFCNGGIAGVFRIDRCVCLDCGRKMTAGWPVQPDVDAAAIVLSKRPEPNRNWRPSTEDVDDLKVENLARGYPIS